MVMPKPAMTKYQHLNFQYFNKDQNFEAISFIKMIPKSQSIATKFLPVWFLGNPSYCFGLKNNGDNNFQM